MQQQQQSISNIDALVFVIPGMGAREDIAGQLQSRLHNPVLKAGMKLAGGYSKYWDSQHCINMLDENLQSVLKARGITGKNVVLRPIDYAARVRSQIAFDDQLNAITLATIPYMRELGNNTAIDVLMYCSGNAVKDTTLAVVRAEMNRTFEELRSRCPTLDSSKVFIIGHSLGSVIGYDLIKESELAREQVTSDGVDKKLNFIPEQFFLLGSPLGLFLLLRAGFKENCPSIQFNDDLLHDTRYYSIYHPLDPVAYRIEPLIDSRFSDVAPLKVPIFNVPNALDQFSAKVTAASEKVSHWLMGLRDGMNLDAYVSPFRDITTSFQKSKKDDSSKKEGQASQMEREDEEAIKNAEDASIATMLAHQESPQLPSAPSADLMRYKRVDHELTVQPVINPYLVSGHTHLAYWEMRDVGAFIIEKMFGAPVAK